MAISNSVPLDGDLPTIPVDVEGHPKTADHPAPVLWFGAISSGYFEMLHIHLTAGRYFTRADGVKSEHVAVISASTARRFWPRDNAIGRHIKPAGSKDWSRIVGVVADTHQYTLATALPNWFAGEIYMPYAQSEREDGTDSAVMKLLVKPGMDSPGFRDSLERIARNSNPDVPIGHVRPLGEITNGSIAEFRATMRVFVSFAGTAILLAAIGIYGLMSQWVGQRTYEIGLRVPLGRLAEADRLYDFEGGIAIICLRHRRGTDRRSCVNAIPGESPVWSRSHRCFYSRPGDFAGGRCRIGGDGISSFESCTNRSRAVFCEPSKTPNPTVFPMPPAMLDHTFWSARPALPAEVVRRF